MVILDENHVMSKRDTGLLHGPIYNICRGGTGQPPSEQFKARPSVCSQASAPPSSSSPLLQPFDPARCLFCLVESWGWELGFTATPALQFNWTKPTLQFFLDLVFVTSLLSLLVSDHTSFRVYVWYYDLCCVPLISLMPARLPLLRVIFFGVWSLTLSSPPKSPKNIFFFCPPLTLIDSIFLY